MGTKDPIGAAIQDYVIKQKPADIIVTSDLCDDDIIPVEVLFRPYKEMPEIEKKALELVKGSILDIGAGAGPHATYLLSKGFEVQAIETSPGAVKYLESKGIPVQLTSIQQLNHGKYDTLLLLMNGLGIAGSLAELPNFLNHLKSLLKAGGQILCDSSDVAFLYEEEDGSYWMDLNAAYYGNFTFQMHYKNHSSDLFKWLYVDYDTLHQTASELGFTCKRVLNDEHHFLAQLTLQ